MGPADNHSAFVLLRALILSAVAALAWLILGAATAQADTGTIGSQPAPQPASVTGAIRPSSAALLAPAASITPENLPESTHLSAVLPDLQSVATDTLPGVAEISAPASAGTGQLIRSVNAVVVLPQTIVVPQVQLPSVLTVADPILGAVVSVPAAVADLAAPSAVGTLTAAEPQAPGQSPPSAMTPPTPDTQLARPVPAMHELAGLNGLQVQIQGRAAVPALGSAESAAGGRPLATPLAPPTAPPLGPTGLSAVAGTGASPSAQDFALPSGWSTVPPLSGLARNCADNLRVPQGPAYDPGSSPD